MNQMYRWMDGWLNGWIDRWAEGWMDGWLDRLIGGWMDGWTDQCRYTNIIYKYLQKHLANVTANSQRF